jgi:FkbH-like protein
VEAAMSEGSAAVKCLVWDLDDTLWDGVLLEDGDIAINSKVRPILETLDSRGILHSIASRNDEEAATAKLRQFGILDYFLYPQINWGSKAESIRAIAKNLNFGIDAIAFVDDQDFERAEVAYTLPEVMCIDARDLDAIPQLPRMMPRFVTDDSKSRRAMYMSDIQRDRAESEFVGSSEEFLASLDIVLTISLATEQDLQRAEELTVRTHQLNSTGYTYSYDELRSFLTSPRHRLLICGLSDRYGTYGKIGLCLIECDPAVWTLKLLLMSCRVMSRGVGTILLNRVMRMAKEAGVRLRAEFVPNGRNRMMNITYKFAGFTEIGRHESTIFLENELARIQDAPTYARVKVDAGGSATACFK